MVGGVEGVVDQSPPGEVVPETIGGVSDSVSGTIGGGDIIDVPNLPNVPGVPVSPL